jgi:sulfopyruvate decarboxylase subunit alpha
MFEGDAVASTLVRCGVTHVVWIPDSVTGTWDEAFQKNEHLEIVRVCREGETFAVASGLWLGGKRPVIQIQCTGMFEAGDSLRNFLHDLKIPLFLIVGLRNYYASREGRSKDSAPRFAEAILSTWSIPFTILGKDGSLDQLAHAYRESLAKSRPAAIFIAE